LTMSRSVLTITIFEDGLSLDAASLIWGIPANLTGKSTTVKKLIKPLVILVTCQTIVMVLGRILRKRYLSDEVGEDGVNAVVVTGGAKHKITTKVFRGGYLRAVMGGVELDQRDAVIEAPPATIEATIVMGGAEIKVPEDWEVKVQARVIAGGVEDQCKRVKSIEGRSPDLVIAGKVVMGGLAINS